VGQSKWHAARHPVRQAHPATPGNRLPAATSSWTCSDTSVARHQLDHPNARTDQPVIHFTPGDPFGVRAGVKAFF
jgi:hypothetical protein